MSIDTTVTPQRLRSTIILYFGVPFDDTYKHVVDFKNHAAIDEYLNSNFYHVTFEGSYQPLNRCIKFPTGKDIKASTNQAANLKFNDLINCNYLKIINTEKSVENDNLTSTETAIREFYAFPTDFIYINDGVTQISFSLDLWNTYRSQLTFTNGYVNKATIDPYTYSDSKTIVNGRSIRKPATFSKLFNRVRTNNDEIGGDGAQVLAQSGYYSFINPYDSNDKSRFDDAEIYFQIFTVQPKDAKTETGTLAGIYNQYITYILPFNPSTNKTVKMYVKNNDNSLTEIVSGGSDLKDIYKTLASDSVFVGTDSLIVDSEVTPYFGLPVYEYQKDSNAHITEIVIDTNGYSLESYDINGTHTLMKINNLDISSFTGQIGVALPNSNYTVNNQTTSTNDLLNSLNKLGLTTPNDQSQGQFENLLGFVSNFARRYGLNTFNSPLPPKLIGGPFLNFQFSDGRGTTLNGNPLATTNQDYLWTSYHTRPDLWLPPVARWSGIAPNAPIQYAYLYENAVGFYTNSFKHRGANEDFLASPSSFEHIMTTDSSAKDTPIILDTYTMYLNANRNQLAVTRTNAEIALQLSKEGNSTTLQNALISANATQQSASVAGYAQTASAGVIASGMIGAANASYNGYRALTGAYGTSTFGGSALSSKINAQATQYSANAQATAGAIQGGATAQEGAINANAQRQQAYNNYAYQNKIAQNNYEQVIRNQNALLADTKNQNDQVAHQGSNVFYDYQNKNIPMWKIYLCQPSVIQSAITWYHLFGITINQYVPINDLLKQFDSFNYIQAQDVNVDYQQTINDHFNTVPQTVLDDFKAIFANGVTIWRPENNHFKDYFYSRNMNENFSVASQV